MSGVAETRGRFAAPAASLQASAPEAPAAALVPDTLAWRLALALPVVAGGLLVGAFLGLVAALFTGLVQITC